jgi:hypothetical protein
MSETTTRKKEAGLEEIDLAIIRGLLEQGYDREAIYARFAERFYRKPILKAIDRIQRDEDRKAIVELYDEGFLVDDVFEVFSDRYDYEILEKWFFADRDVRLPTFSGRCGVCRRPLSDGRSCVVCAATDAARLRYERSVRRSKWSGKR